jgi:glycosyltransferase involved in cell wall biosynthesis
MKNLDLTIGIPTYNRREDLQRLLESLQPLFAISSFSLVISDNASDYDLSPLIEKYISNKWPWIRLTMVKNKINLGAGPNILRIIERCDTKWVMIIGDDDEADADLFQSLYWVCEELNNDSDIIGVKFSSNLDEYQKDKKINSIDSFLCYISESSRFSSMILISSWLFRTESVSQFLRQSYQYSSLYMPHIIPVLLSLNSGKYVLLSSDRAIRWNPPSRGQAWSYVSTFMPMLVTLPLFSEIFSDRKSVQKLISGILVGFKSKIKFFCLIFLSNNYSIYAKFVCSRQIASYSLILFVSRYISMLLVLIILLGRHFKINIAHSLIDSGTSSRM